MNKEELLQFINENIKDEFDFTGGVDESKVRYIETKLNVTLPSSYKWFLQTFGMGGIFGVDILGFGKSPSPPVVTQTERYRKLGLPIAYVVIENCDEFVYCLATDNMLNEECPVISWDRIDGFDSEEAGNFIEFLAERFSDAKEDSDFTEE